MTRITILALLLFALGIGTASADWPNEALSYRGYKRDLYWSRYFCGGKYREEGCDEWRWRRKWRSRQATVSSGDALCQQLIEATGDQAQSKENAEALALRTWQGRVRFRYGERYIQFENARDARIVCSPSSVADTVGGKIQEKLLNISHFRCELSARPCRAQPQKVGDDD